MSKKRQLYFHIGSYKTGSTDIQRFLATNTKNLLKQGVLYPHFARQQDRHYELVIRYSSERFRAENKIYADEEITLLKKRFDAEVEKSTAEKIILSAEEFSWPLASQQWKLIKTLSDGYEIFVIVYLRRQDELIMSLYNQIVKNTLNTKVPLLDIVQKKQSSFSGFIETLLDHYETMLSDWSTLVENNSIVVTPYEGEVQNDVVGHFLKCVNIEYRDEMDRPEDRDNVSMPHTLIKLKRVSVTNPLATTI
ncbi:MAG: hypothetical protein GY821_17170 [Gammaproteobacteria bacterium]|nr:hypothetical protein [Gammaproteobacteria bacterium]